MNVTIDPDGILVITADFKSDIYPMQQWLNTNAKSIACINVKLDLKPKIEEEGESL